MPQTAATGTTTRGLFWTIVIRLAIAAAAVIGTLAYQSASSPVPSFREAQALGAPRGAPPSASSLAPSFVEFHRGDGGGGVTREDGALPDGVTAFDAGYPGVANLDPDLLQALRAATKDAADDGVALFVNSGWRSVAYQNQLLREAVSEYGSKEEAARWVAPAETSAHVSGDAVDVGPVDVMVWLGEHGAAYGLCQIYGNEPWHFELRLAAIDRGCPRMHADSAHASRLQP